MHGKACIVGMVLIATLILTGCDSYSILDQFKKDGDSGVTSDPVTPPEQLTLTIEKDTVVPYGTATLYPVGGTKPYRFEVFGKDLYEGTKNNAFGTFVESTFTAGRAIGVLTIRVVDAAEKTAEVTVTVIPPTPESCLITRDSSSNFGTAYLSWTYEDSTIIDRFEIVRAPAFTTPPTIGKLKTYEDNPLSPPNAYTYELIAVAGSFRSATVTLAAPGKP
jgi:hypothetical protein